jgi:hypothetical protein
MVGILRSARVEWRRPFLSFLGSPTLELVTPDNVRHTLDASGLPPPGDASFQLRAAGSLDRVDALAGTTRLREGLAYFLPEEPLAILFDLGEGPWQIPWELMLHGIDDERARANFIPIRVAGGRLAPSPVRRVDQLSVLILYGDPGELHWRIDPKKEADEVVAAWTDLPEAVKTRIAKPIVVPLDAAALPAQLAQHQPHILWYCGHGQASPRAELLQAPNLWVDAAVLARALPENPPLACVLWACELGQAPPDRVAPAPAIHAALSARGVGLTLAMQSRIADRVARSMARTFFESLAMGLSVERASAAARRSALALSWTNPDWGSPALWTTRSPASALSWKDAPDDDLLHNLLSWASIRLVGKTPEVDAADDEARNQARAWLEGHRILVQADTLAEATLAELGRIAAAMDELKRAPLFIRLRGKSFAEGLADWARKVLDWIAVEQLPTPLGQALALAPRDAIGAIRKIMACPDVALVLIDPPLGLGHDLRHLFERGEGAAPVIVVGASPDESEWPGWVRAGLVSTVDHEVLDRLLATAGAMLTALAVLDMALPERRLGDLGFDRALFPAGSGLLFETRAGPMLTAAARSIVLELADGDMVRDAHRAGAELLAGLGGGEELEFERLRHLAAIGSSDALEVGGGLIERLAREARHVSVLRAFELLKPLGVTRYDLQARRLLAVARAWVVLGEALKADMVLKRLPPQTPLESGLTHALRSEVEKMLGRPGWRDRALREIELAIETVRPLLASDDPQEAEAAQIDLVSWQMNRARIRQYLFYDRGAIAAYRDILAAWEGDARLSHTLAVAARNLAEAIAFAADGDPAALEESEFELSRAEQLLANAPNDLLLAEIAYERIKLAERRHADSATRLGLFDLCIRTAYRVGHSMVEAIATARRFRTLEAFDAAAWARIERSLEDHGSHGWAFRVAANGRLHAARALAAAGDGEAAMRELERNWDRLKTRPAFDSGTDRDRQALTLAGLISLSADPQAREKYGRAAADLSWLGEWLAMRGVTNLQQAWKG